MVFSPQQWADRNWCRQGGHKVFIQSSTPTLEALFLFHAFLLLIEHVNKKNVKMSDKNGIRVTIAIQVVFNAWNAFSNSGFLRLKACFENIYLMFNYVRWQLKVQKTRGEEVYPIKLRRRFRKEDSENPNYCPVRLAFNHVVDETLRHGSLQRAWCQY